jgi:leucine dehydrogenase
VSLKTSRFTNYIVRLPEQFDSVETLNMKIIEKETNAEHELVLYAEDPAIDYRAFIAVHSTALGPAVGGARFWNYKDKTEALTDVLRLARGMTYKNALAGLPLGGGKSVIIGDNKRTDREELFRAHGRFVETLKGRYVTAEDVGMSPADMELVRRETRHVAGLLNGSGDPAPITARGVFRAIEATVKHLWNGDNFSGLSVALQGCGHVGYHLAKMLHDAGGKLFVTDVDAEKMTRVVEEFGAVQVKPEEIYQTLADIFAPCALGGVINDETIPQLRVRAVVGAANNQLLEERHGEILQRRGILYAPDYAANAGGIINICIELLGWERERALKQVDGIYGTILDIFETADAEKIPTNKIADRLAKKRIGEAAGESGRERVSRR